jgi:hypothetical protein
MRLRARGTPQTIKADNGSEFISKAMDRSHPLLELVATNPQLQRSLRRRLLSLLEQTNRGELELLAEPLSLAHKRQQFRCLLDLSHLTSPEVLSTFKNAPGNPV